MPDALQAIPFSKKLLTHVKDFDFGDEPYQQELGYWLRAESLSAIQFGTQVWLYANRDNEIVGYGSLGLDDWNPPEGTGIDLLVIPAVALRKEYWGHPPEAEREDRYSSKILRHLIERAEAMPRKLPLLGLFVHPDNAAAIKLYERHGFRPFNHKYRDEASGVEYRTYLRKLKTT